IVNLALPRALKEVSQTKFGATPGKVPGEHTRTAHRPRLFQVGAPALDAFPRKRWTRIAARVARQLDSEQMANPNLRDVMGYEPLRRAIASYLQISRDIACSADQILITAGFQGALGLIIQA